MANLEEQLRRERALGKGWQTQLKKIETYLMIVGMNTGEKKSTKKLLEEKSQTIDN